MTLLSTKTLAWAADLSLSADTTLSTEGYFVISWISDAESQSPVLLQQSPSENFGATITREFTLPPNSSITIAGLEDGQYFFRATEPGMTAFSNTVAVEVAHHSLQRALGFFFVGLVLLLILIATIIRGNRSLKVDEKVVKKVDKKEGPNAS